MRWVGIVIVTACSYTAPPTETPVDGAPADEMVADPCAVTAIAAYGAHTCVVRADGSVWCWGNDDHLELGVASSTSCTTDDVPCSPSPLQVSIAPATAIGMGDEQTCATTANGTMCWGRNEDGELGTGSSERGTLPVLVPARAGAVEFVGGQTHLCSRDQASTVSCAGNNQLGELGDGTGAQQVTPVSVELGGGATTIGGGYNHTCAIVGGIVSCWGSNTSNQVDASSDAIKLAPVARTDITNAVQVVGGVSHSCVRLADQTAMCWGGNDEGQLGDGTTTNTTVRTPTLVALTGIEALSAGVDHTCALAGGQVSCWGENYTARPAVVALPGPATLIASGSYHDCAVLTDGSTWCWHWQAFGQLGNGTIDDQFATVAVQAVTCP
ncbi:MAG: hypothetical protein H0V17_28680 [Deltaproteobacteria bacterium]|nr:hypothetical protein [Deltaproteobacteria bacterium]